MEKKKKTKTLLRRCRFLIEILKFRFEKRIEASSSSHWTLVSSNSSDAGRPKRFLLLCDIMYRYIKVILIVKRLYIWNKLFSKNSCIILEVLTREFL